MRKGSIKLSVNKIIKFKECYAAIGIGYILLDQDFSKFEYMKQGELIDRSDDSILNVLIDLSKQTAFTQLGNTQLFKQDLFANENGAKIISPLHIYDTLRSVGNVTITA